MNKKNVLIADLLVGYVKLHNIHFNVVGNGFKEAHEYFEHLYDDVHDFYDEVAERVRMDGDIPVASVKKYLELTTIKDAEDKEHSIEEAYKIALDLYKSFKNSVHELRNEADEKGDYAWVGLMEDIADNLDKEIWMMESFLK